MNSNILKHGKFDYLQLVCHFTIPSSIIKNGVKLFDNFKSFFILSQLVNTAACGDNQTEIQMCAV